LIAAEQRINKLECVIGGLHGAGAGGQEFAAEGEEEAGNFFKEFIPHRFMNAKGRAAHPLSVPAVVTVGFDFPTAYTDYDNGVGKRVTYCGVMPAVKNDPGSCEKRL
jgi:hypothetical protein